MSTAMIERRFVPAARGKVEVREAKSGPGTVSGLAAVFYDPADPGTSYRLWDDVEERVMPGTFDRAVAERDDVRALVDHDPSRILGRTAAGTARVLITAKGLAYEADAPDTQAGRDIVTSIKRGDVTGSSFGFSVTDEDIRVEKRDGKELWIREIRGVVLYDVSPVTFPAYEATSADARAEFRKRVDGLAEARRIKAAAGVPKPSPQTREDIDLAIRLAEAE